MLSLKILLTMTKFVEHVHTTDTLWRTALSFINIKQPRWARSEHLTEIKQDMAKILRIYDFKLFIDIPLANHVCWRSSADIRECVNNGCCLFIQQIEIKYCMIKCTKANRPYWVNKHNFDRQVHNEAVENVAVSWLHGESVENVTVWWLHGEAVDNVVV